jgi:DNA repair ATPase RecN
MKLQSKRHHVVVVTHNAAIAATADKHYVVTRQYQSLTDGPNRDKMMLSKLHQVSGIERENEIIRMTVGNLKTDSGVEKQFAAELLQYHTPSIN